MERAHLLAILSAYHRVQAASWPDLNPDIDARALTWAGMSEEELAAELQRLLTETERPGFEVRVFWKLGPEYTYGGCNDRFARDAGLDSAVAMVGKTDFDTAISWLRQAAKYRSDDVEVVTRGADKLNIIERQRSASGNVWLRTGKAPIRTDAPRATIGVLGMYEIIDVQTALRLDPRLSR
jgi:hypothetical protein